jgi:hypothetical protein
MRSAKAPVGRGTRQLQKGLFPKKTFANMKRGA